MGKNGVSGIYDCDPKSNKNAKKFGKISYDEILDKKPTSNGFNSHKYG